MIGWVAVGVAEDLLVKIQSVLRRKTGSRDTESAWAKARLERCKMTKRMLKLGEQFAKGEKPWSEMRRSVSHIHGWNRLC